MDYRIGKCSACDAVYKVPASFSHDTAKCKECGGVVNVGPVQSGAPADAPAPEAKGAVKAPPVPARQAPSRRRAPASKAASGNAAPRATAAGAGLKEIPVKKKKRSGPSMKEQLLARRRAEAAGAAPTAAAPTSGEAELTPEPVELQPEPAATAGRSSTRSTGSRREAGRRSGSGAGRRTAGGGRGSRRGRGTEREKAKKKSSAPIWGGLAALVVVAGGAAYLFREQIFPPSPDDGVRAADAGSAETAAPSGDAADVAAGGAPAGAAGEPEVEAPAEASAGESAPDGSPSGDASAEDAAAEGETAPAGEDVADSYDAELDLSDLAPFGPIDETPTSEWEKLEADAALFVDDDAGAAANRARQRLLAARRKAFPAVLNEMAKLDLTTDDGRRTGDLCQRLLSEIIDGQNFGWKYSDDVKDAVFNARVVRRWHSAWDRAEEDIDYWIVMARLDEAAASELRARLGGSAVGSDDPGAGLDVDEDDLLDVDD